MKASILGRYGVASCFRGGLKTDYWPLNYHGRCPQLLLPMSAILDPRWRPSWIHECGHLEFGDVMHTGGSWSPYCRWPLFWMQDGGHFGFMNAAILNSGTSCKLGLKTLFQWTILLHCRICSRSPVRDKSTRKTMLTIRKEIRQLEVKVVQNWVKDARKNEAAQEENKSGWRFFFIFFRRCDSIDFGRSRSTCARRTRGPDAENRDPPKHCPQYVGCSLSRRKLRPQSYNKMYSLFSIVRSAKRIEIALAERAQTLNTLQILLYILNSRNTKNVLQ